MEGKDYFVHESSYVDEPSEIGKGTKIWHFSHVMPNCKIGENCNIGQNVVISPDVFLGPSCVFTNVINPRSFISRKDEYRKTLIGKGASIGANATIVCGHNIGKYAFVAAGAVVTKNIPDYALVMGNPARVKYFVCECSEKMNFVDNKFICPVCGKKYIMENDIVKEIK